MSPRLSEKACEVAKATLACPSVYFWLAIVPTAVGLTLLTVHADAFRRRHGAARAGVAVVVGREGEGVGADVAGRRLVLDFRDRAVDRAERAAERFGGVVGPGSARERQSAGRGKRDRAVVDRQGDGFVHLRSRRRRTPTIRRSKGSYPCSSPVSPARFRPAHRSPSSVMRSWRRPSSSSGRRRYRTTSMVRSIPLDDACSTHRSRCPVLA